MIQLLYIFWDPKPEIFTIPVLHYPVLWYGALFALGFVLGFPLFVNILQRYFLQKPDFIREDIRGECAHPRLEQAGIKGKGPLVEALNQWLYSSDPIAGFPAAKNSLSDRRLQLEKLLSDGIFSLKKQATAVADRLTVYMVVATVLGARIGHLVFYEPPAYYLNHPMQIFAVWKGGLSSHGAAIAIILTLGYFSYSFRSQMRGLSWLGLMDFVCVPTALAGTFIRVGNFFNQEVLGITTNVPWAIIFGHPADNTLPAPRHPVQLYEALAYAVIFLVLWRLTFIPKYLNQKGRLMGLFLTLVFGFRIIVEYWKMEQSALISYSSEITMGQILSVPLVLVGLYLFFRKRG